MTSVILTGGRVWDGGEEARPAEVRIVGERIEAVSAGWNSLPREGAELVDAGGAMILPGLTDAHGHLSFPLAGVAQSIEDTPPEETVLLTLHAARLMLDMGFTGVVCAGSPKLRSEVVIRNEINAGRIAGPRLMASTPTLTTTGGLNDNRQEHQEDRSVAAIIVDGPDEIRRAIRRGYREGVDVVKVNISGDDFFPRPSGRTTMMTRAEVEAVAETADNLGLLVSAHARSAESIKLAVAAGIGLINHADFADEAALDALEAAKDRVFVAPSIGYYHSLLHDSGLPPALLERMAVEDAMAHNIATHQELRRRGVRAVIGGDYGLPWQPNGTNARDIAHFVEYLGYSPVEALRAATLNGADLMGVEAGRIAPGRLADLILVDGDPLTDPRVLARQECLLGVMKGGVFHRRPGAPASPSQTGLRVEVSA